MTQVTFLIKTAANEQIINTKHLARDPREPQIGFETKQALHKFSEQLSAVLERTGSGRNDSNELLPKFQWHHVASPRRAIVFPKATEGPNDSMVMGSSVKRPTNDWVVDKFSQRMLEPESKQPISEEGVANDDDVNGSSNFSLPWNLVATRRGTNKMGMEHRALRAGGPLRETRLFFACRFPERRRM